MLEQLGAEKYRKAKSKTLQSLLMLARELDETFKQFGKNLFEIFSDRHYVEQVSLLQQRLAKIFS